MATISLAKIKPGTTPLLTVVVDDVAIQDATVYVTIEVGHRRLLKSTRHSDDSILLEPVYSENLQQIGTQVTVQYTQVDTLYLRPGYAKVEVGWVFDDDTADKSNIGRLFIPKTLFKDVMYYG